MALFSLGSDLAGMLVPDHHDSIVVGDHGIARFNIDSCADHRDVDGAERRLDRALGRNRPRPHRKTHLAQRFHTRQPASMTRPVTPRAISEVASRSPNIPSVLS